jgi:hypothetical protein
LIITCIYSQNLFADLIPGFTIRISPHGFSYITWQIRLACLAKPVQVKKDIHAQLEETVAERNPIMQQMEKVSQRARIIDMYLDVTKAA